MPRARSKAAPLRGKGPLGLALHEAAARVQALLRERARLARDAQKKKQQLEQLRQRLSSEAHEVAVQMAPLVERHGALVVELTALFNELLAPGRIPKRGRAHVAQLRRSLELQGVLSAIEESADDDSVDDGDEPWAEAPFGARAQPARGSRSRAAPAAEVPGARQVGQEKRSLRDIFRNLARAIHPDKAQHEADRAQRTEVMKQVTRAYEDGDLARLVELESAWQSQLAEIGAGDPEARCRELERINRELLDQVRQLTRQIRDTKRDAQDALGGTSPDELIATATQELDDLESLALLLREFRSGRLTLAELIRRTSPTEDEVELLEALMLQELAASSVPSRRPSRRRS